MQISFNTLSVLSFQCLASVTHGLPFVVSLPALVFSLLSSRVKHFATQQAVFSFITSLPSSVVLLPLSLSLRVSQRRATVSFHYATGQSSLLCPLCALIGSNAHTYTHLQVYFSPRKWILLQYKQIVKEKWLFHHSAIHFFLLNAIPNIFSLCDALWAHASYAISIKVGPGECGSSSSITHFQYLTSFFCCTYS